MTIVNSLVFLTEISYTEGHYLKDPINFYATAFYLPSYISANETTSSNIVSVSLDYYGKRILIHTIFH